MYNDGRRINFGRASSEGAVSLWKAHGAGGFPARDPGFQRGVQTPARTVCSRRGTAFLPYAGLRAPSSCRVIILGVKSLTADAALSL